MKLEDVVTAPVVILPKVETYTKEDLENAYRLGERMGIQVARNPDHYSFSDETMRAKQFMATYRSKTKL